MHIENVIEVYHRELIGVLNNEYRDLYESIGNEKLVTLFATLHFRVVSLFNQMNQRLPTVDEPAHFWAQPSRDLIRAIEIIEGLEKSLKKSEFSFKLADYYHERLLFCKTFLRTTGGSTIPPKTEKLNLYYKIPIFEIQSVITIRGKENFSAMVLIGEGSYAKVFKYFDSFYLRTFALKRAKDDLNSKELERFIREYRQMSSLRSPYVLEVFGLDEAGREYVMEYMDETLEKYISSNNAKLSSRERLNLGLQIIKAFKYIHSRKILHRDITPKNILVKKYDDVIVVKIADFGMVKTPDSDLTSMDTDLKGYFNDPNLRVEGFDRYDILHETYALTRVLYFVLSGRTKTDRIPEKYRFFVEKGLNSDKRNRFKNTDELRDAFQSLQQD